MITEIRKRDGRIEPFDASKIANAITKAMVSVDVSVPKLIDVNGI